MDADALKERLGEREDVRDLEALQEVRCDPVPRADEEPTQHSFLNLGEVRG